MKRGETERSIDGRTFTDVTLDGLSDLVSGLGLSVAEAWVSPDVRPGRDEAWVNLIALKAAGEGPFLER